jgi:hypothetical protein
MVVAPAVSMVAGFSVTVATPLPSVKAVTAGVIVASVTSVLKVTTELATTPPAASLNVAFTVAGAPMEMEVTGAPAALVSANVSVGTPGATGVAGVAGAPDAGKLLVSEGLPGPGLHPARTASVAAMKSEAERFEIFWLKNFWAKKRQFFTQVPGYATRIDTVSLRWRHSD